MKSFFVVAMLVAAALAAPQRGPDADAQVLRYESDNIGVDGYNYGFETSNGISQQEQGQLKNAGSENEAISVRGQYSYTGPDGVVYSVTYVADENGFQPQGAHLPVAP
ncbi:flexible cuticle protein 12 [Amyelois transitella]|uniref:flexible cuticle protein 12 n=1 Tax=Amyelois transitella TaxID=680683 RepID=UPI00067D19C8|nr:flexible cuticle protein 12 [Amyelois transitella]